MCVCACALFSVIRAGSLATDKSKEASGHRTDLVSMMLKGLARFEWEPNKRIYNEKYVVHAHH